MDNPEELENHSLSQKKIYANDKEMMLNLDMSEVYERLENYISWVEGPITQLFRPPSMSLKTLLTLN